MLLNRINPSKIISNYATKARRCQEEVVSSRFCAQRFGQLSRKWKSFNFQPKNVSNEVSPICLYMVPVDRGRFELFRTGWTKCTSVCVLLMIVQSCQKNRKKTPVLYKVNGSKVIFFNRKMFQTKSLQSLRQLDCWIANRLNYTNPGEQNWDRALEGRNEVPKLLLLYFPIHFFQINQLILLVDTQFLGMLYDSCWMAVRCAVDIDEPQKQQFSVPRRNKPKFYESICNSCKWISEGLKCMEPLDRNFAFLLFFNYSVRKLTKNNKNVWVLHKSMKQCSKKAFFFSPEKKQTKFSWISSWVTLLQSW